MIKAVLFDIGGVILPKIEERYKSMRKITGADIDFKSKETMPDFIKMVKGQITTAEFCQMMEKRFQLKINLLELWEQLEKEALKSINQELLELIKKLRKNYRIGLITDASDLSSRLCREQGIYAYFEPCVVSCEVGYKKPEKGIFEVVLKKADLKPDECIFIDDREENLIVPKQMGFHTIHFQRNEQLINDLKKHGIVIS